MNQLFEELEKVNGTQPHNDNNSSMNKEDDKAKKGIITPENLEKDNQLKKILSEYERKLEEMLNEEKKLKEQKTKEEELKHCAWRCS